ncbi:hypothetical protein [Microvirga pakistanensis]|uniref:hypothetical protein n=1 Tax=Microvirga pakistanensis TaxID=1682650 RepID=UPI001958F853|nr:hypothetical protein [Microvirga pakistanensis]
MKNRTPKLVTYGCAYDKAVDIVCDRGLLHCEPLPEPFHGFCFADERDLTYVATAVAGEVEFYDNVVIGTPKQQAQIEEFIELIEAEARVERVDLLGVLFWNAVDETIFNEALGLPA